MAFIVPWMFVRFGLRATLLMAAGLNMVGAVAKYPFSFAGSEMTVLTLTYVAQGRKHSLC